MEWQESWDNPLTTYVRDFNSLFGDHRSAVTFAEIVQGIIGAGSLICQRIAAHSTILMQAKDGAQRVIRFAKGKSTTRSQIDAESLTAKLREQGVAHLSESESEELWLILDPSDLRKPYAREMETLMKVRNLNGDMVPGYRTVNVLGVTPGRRGILYHRLFSTEEEDFLSESAEIQRALQTTSQALAQLKERMEVSWIVDRGLDDVAVWRTIWEQKEHVVCRVKHTERLVEFLNEQNEWQAGDIDQARRQLRLMTTARTKMEVCVGRQRRPKMQWVIAEIRTCPVRLTYETNVRREGPGETVRKVIWLVEIRLQGTRLEPWLLMTDWSVTDPESALRIFQMYRQRWAVEDSFKFTKECLGWEDIQLLKLNAVRTMVALAWVAAGFLYEMGITLDWPEVQFLARLGGWVPRPDRKPGKIVITSGLRRLMDMLATEAFLNGYVAEHGSLPPRISALLGIPPARDL